MRRVCFEAGENGVVQFVRVAVTEERQRDVVEAVEVGDGAGALDAVDHAEDDEAELVNVAAAGEGG